MNLSLKLKTLYFTNETTQYIYLKIEVAKKIKRNYFVNRIR